MLKLFLNKKAQNTMEYALLIAIVVGAFTGMQLYLRRGLQLRIKAATDNIPTKVRDSYSDASVNGKDVFGALTQYEPYYTREGTYAITTYSTSGTEKGTINKDGGRREAEKAQTKRVGNQDITYKAKD